MQLKNYCTIACFFSSKLAVMTVIGKSSPVVFLGHLFAMPGKPVLVYGIGTRGKRKINNISFIPGVDCIFCSSQHMIKRCMKNIRITLVPVCTQTQLDPGSPCPPSPRPCRGSPFPPCCQDSL